MNGEVCDNPALRIDPAKDVVEYRGKRIILPSKKTACLILYKTAGYVTSTGDPHHRKTVYQLLPKAERGTRWLYVGRLDKDTEGLLVFTDSGELVHALSHPSYKVAKHYRVEVAGRLGRQDLKKLERGFEVEGRLMKMDQARILPSEKNITRLELVLHHGEKRQIKRMLGQLGYRVISLCRTRFGPLTLAGLKPGECRRLEEKEMEDLMRAIGKTG